MYMNSRYGSENRIILGVVRSSCKVIKETPRSLAEKDLEENLFSGFSDNGYVNSYVENQTIDFLTNLYTAIGRFDIGDIYPFLGTSTAVQALSMRGNNLTGNGAITHGLYGSKGNGSDSYWDTGLIPSTFNNDAIWLIACNNLDGRNGSTQSVAPAGRLGAIDGSHYMFASDGTIVDSDYLDNRLMSFSRIGDEMQLWENGSYKSNATGANFREPPDRSIYLLAANQGTAAGHSNGLISFFLYLKSFPFAKTTLIYNLISNYLLSIGHLPITSNTSAADAATNYFNKFRIHGSPLSSSNQSSISSLFSVLKTQGILHNLVHYADFTKNTGSGDPLDYSGQDLEFTSTPTWVAEGIDFNGVYRGSLDFNLFKESEGYHFICWGQTEDGPIDRMAGTVTGPSNGGFSLRNGNRSSDTESRAWGLHYDSGGIINATQPQKSTTGSAGGSNTRHMFQCGYDGSTNIYANIDKEGRATFAGTPEDGIGLTLGGDPDTSGYDKNMESYLAFDVSLSQAQADAIYDEMV